MSENERKDRIIYYACRHAIGVVESELKKKRSKPVASALELERQGYVDLGNEIAAEHGLEPLA